MAGPTPPTPAELLTLTERAFVEAAAGAGETVLRRSVAGHPVELRVAGRDLADLLGRALPEHPATGPARQIVRAWDEKATGVSYPLDEEPLLQVAAWRRRGPWLEVGVSGLRVMHQPFEDTLGILADGRAWYWTKDAASLPYYEHSAPLLHLLHWWLGERDLHLVHAGAVGTPAGGVLIVGPGGSGKSTTTLACLGSALGVVADDYTVVGLAPHPRALALYRTAKLERGHDRLVERRIAGLPAVVNPVPAPNDKALYFLEDLEPEVPLRAVLVPWLSGRADHRIVPVTRSAAFAALAPSSILQLPGAGGRALTTLRSLLDLVPVYGLELGTELATNPDAHAEVCR